jgi:hypothetical protein
MNKLTLTLSVIFSVLIMQTACKKKKGCTDETALNYSVDATKDDGSCEFYEADTSEANADAATGSMTGTTEDFTVYTMVAGEGESDVLSGKQASFDSTTIPACATVTLDSDGINVWPKTLTIDFGSSGCECFDGKTRKGKIVAIFTGFWKTHDEGDSIIVSFENYYVGDTMITGTRYFWVEDYVTISGNLKVGYKVEDASIVFPDGTVSWEGEGTFDVTGLTTPTDISDDEFELDVAGSATSMNGDTYTFETSSPLLTKIDCIDDCIFIGGSFSVASIVESDTTVTYAGISYSYNLATTTTVSFNFGDGSACDDQFSISTDLKVESDGVTFYEEEISNDEYTCSALDTL